MRTCVEPRRRGAGPILMVCRSTLFLPLLLSLPVTVKDTSAPRCHRAVAVQAENMDSFDHLSASEKAEASELQKMIAIEQQKAQFQAQVHSFTDVCWDKCVDSPGSKLDYRTETCLVNCVERFIDTTLSITNRFTQMVQKGAH